MRRQDNSSLLGTFVRQAAVSLRQMDFGTLARLFDEVVAYVNAGARPVHPAGKLPGRPQMKAERGRLLRRLMVAPHSRQALCNADDAELGQGGLSQLGVELFLDELRQQLLGEHADCNWALAEARAHVVGNPRRWCAARG